MRERMKTEEKMRWNTMTLEFESRPCNESFARVSAAAFLAQLNPTVEEVADVKTAVSEAVTNAIIHGYEKRQGKIRIFCRISENQFFMEVSDKGKGILNVEEAMQPMYTTKPEEDRSGMGFAFMEAFMDEVKVESEPEKGTCVRMKKIIGKGRELWTTQSL
jgi:stage II sporulation protein AB (anti-sigma F factor)